MRERKKERERERERERKKERERKEFSEGIKVCNILRYSLVGI